MSCSMTTSAGAHLVAQAQQHRCQRLDLALGDPAGRLVEQDHRRPVRRPGRRGRRRGACPVDSSRTNELRYAPRSISSISSSTRSAVRSSSSNTIGRRSAAASTLRLCRPTARARPPASRDGHVGEQPGVLEAATEPARGAPRGPSVRDVAAAEHDPAAVGGDEAADQVEQRGLAGAVRTDDADDLALGDGERHVVDGADAAERARQADRPRAPRRRRAGSSTAAVGTRPRCRSTHRCVGDRNTERSRSGRSSSSAVGPENRIAPRSMKYARSATVERDVDALLDEDHRHAVVGQPANDRQQLADDDRREAERQLVDQQHPRPGDEGHASASICCCPPRESAAATSMRSRRTGNSLEHLGDRGRDIGRRRGARVHPASCEVLGDGQRAEHALPARHLADARARRSRSAARA